METRQSVLRRSPLHLQAATAHFHRLGPEMLLGTHRQAGRPQQGVGTWARAITTADLRRLAEACGGLRWSALHPWRHAVKRLGPG